MPIPTTPPTAQVHCCALPSECLPPCGCHSPTWRLPFAYHPGQKAGTRRSLLSPNTEPARQLSTPIALDCLVSSTPTWASFTLHLLHTPILRIRVHLHRPRTRSLLEFDRSRRFCPLRRLCAVWIVDARGTGAKTTHTHLQVPRCPAPFITQPPSDASNRPQAPITPARRHLSDGSRETTEYRGRGRLTKPRQHLLRQPRPFAT